MCSPRRRPESSPPEHPAAVASCARRLHRRAVVITHGMRGPSNYDNQSASSPPALPAAPSAVSIPATSVAASPRPIPAASPAPSPTADVGPAPLQRLQVGNTAGAGANLRAQPDAQAERVELLPDGALVDLVDPGRDVGGTVWREVRAQSGATGWVAAEFLSPVTAVEIRVSPLPISSRRPLSGSRHRRNSSAARRRTTLSG